MFRRCTNHRGLKSNIERKDRKKKKNEQTFPKHVFHRVTAVDLSVKKL
jgi:hypothetical protein